MEPEGVPRSSFKPEEPESRGMVVRKLEVERGKLQPGLLPSWASQYVVASEWLAQRGILEQIKQQLNIVRQGGYSGLDGMLFLGATFSAG
jgi:hypothetical protein